MTQFQGPIELANDQWVRSLTQAGTGVPTVSPAKNAADIIREQSNLVQMRSALASGVAKKQAQARRAELVDRGILRRRESDPEGEAERQRMRAVPRLTVSQINRMTRPQMIQLLNSSGGNTVGDQRGTATKFMDLIDLPRDSVLQAAVAEEQDLEEIAIGAGTNVLLGAIGGAAVGFLTGGPPGAVIGGVAGAVGTVGGMAAGAGIGGVIGGLSSGTKEGAITGALTGGAIGGVFGGPGGMIAKAGKGAISGGVAYAGSYGTTQAASRIFLDDDERAEIRAIAASNERGGFDRPRIWMSDVLQGVGVENKAARAILGFVGDVAIDPTTYISGGGNKVMWGTSGARAIAVEHRGAKYLRHASKQILNEGRMSGNKLILPPGSVYKPLEDLVNNTLSLKMADDVPEALLDIGPGLDRAKRIRESLEAVGTAGGMTRKQRNAATRKIELAIQDDLITARGFTPQAYTNKNLIAMGDISRDFFRRFQARADFQVHVPFADLLSPLLYRTTGYRNLGQNIPLKLMPGPRRAQYKALHNADEAFLAAEDLARKARFTESMNNMGRYASTTLVLGKRSAQEAQDAINLMPESLRSKLSYSKNSPLGKIAEGAKTQRGIRVSITELDSKEYTFLKGQGFRVEAPVTTNLDDVVDEAAMVRALEERDRATRVDGYSDIIDHIDDHTSLNPTIAAARADLVINGEVQGVLRKMHAEQTKKGEDSAFTAAVMAEANSDIKKAQGELDSLLANKSLDEAQIESLITPRTSEILNAADGLYGDVSGVALGVYGGPGFLGRAFRGHNAKGAAISERLNRVAAEKREGIKKIDDQISQITGQGVKDRATVEGLRQQRAILQRKLDEAVGEYAGPSEKALSKAEEVASSFGGLGTKEKEALAVAIDFASDAIALRKGITKDEAIIEALQIVEGGITPEGRAVFFQPTVDAAKVKNIYVIQEFEPAIAGTAGAAGLFKKSKNKGFEALDDMSDMVGISGAYRSSGITRVGNGFSAGGLVRFGEAVSPAQVRHLAHAGALHRGHRGFSIFTPSTKGPDTSFILQAGDNRNKVVASVDEIFADVQDPLVKISVSEDGTIAVMNSSRNKKLKKSIESKVGQLKERLNVTAEEKIQGTLEIKTATGKTDDDFRRWHYAHARLEEKAKGAKRILDERGNDHLRVMADKADLEEGSVFFSLNEAIRLFDVGIRKEKEWTGGDWLKQLGQNAPRTKTVGQYGNWPYLDPSTGKPYRIPDLELKNSGLQEWLLQNESRHITRDDIDNFLSGEATNASIRMGPPQGAGQDFSTFVESGPKSPTVLGYYEMVMTNLGINPNMFKSNHFTSDKGYLYHIRFTERMYNGLRTLQVEEIQSDLFQEITKRRTRLMRQGLVKAGIRIDDGENIESVFRAAEKAGKIDRQRTMRHIDETVSSIMGVDVNQALMQPSRAKVNGAPVPYWERHAIKQVLKHANREGYEQVVFSDGRIMHDVLNPASVERNKVLHRFMKEGMDYQLEVVGSKTHIPSVSKFPMGIEVKITRAGGGEIDEALIPRVKDPAYLPPGGVEGDYLNRHTKLSSDGKTLTLHMANDAIQMEDYPTGVANAILGAKGSKVSLPNAFNPGLIRAYDNMPGKFNAVAEELDAPLVTTLFRNSDQGIPLDLSALSSREYLSGVDANRVNLLTRKYRHNDYGELIGPNGEVIIDPDFVRTDADEMLDLLKDEVEVFVDEYVGHFEKSINDPAAELLNPGLARRLRIMYYDQVQTIMVPKVKELLSQIESEAANFKELGLSTEDAKTLFKRVIGLGDEGVEGRSGIKIPDRSGQEFKRQGDVLFQTADGTARASVEFIESGGSIVRALNAPDLGSFIHELGHIVRRGLDDKTLAKLNRYFNIEGEIWPVLQEERFAQAFMQFIQDGRAPTPELQGAFDTLSRSMKMLYDKNYDAPMRGSLRRSLEAAFGASPEDVVRAKEFRSNRAKVNRSGTKINQLDARTIEDNASIVELGDKRQMMNQAANEVMAPLQQELAAHNSTFTARAAQISERFDRTFRDLTGAGRRYTPTGQSVSQLRYGLENTPEFEQKMFIREFDGAVETISKKHGINREESQMLVHAKIMEVEKKMGRTGYHASDAIHSIRDIAERGGGFDNIWNDPQIQRLAEKISDKHRQMAIYEAEVGALMTADPSFGYIPLKLTDEAAQRAWAMNAIRRQRAGAGGRKLTVQEGATVHRETNQHWFPVESGGRHTDEAGQQWDYVWSGELSSPGGTKNPAYEEYRLARLRENPELMLSGDVFEYNQKLLARGAGPDQLMPGGSPEGPRWQVEATPVSPYQLKNHESELRHKFGNDFVDAVWETDLGLVLANRIKQHHRIRAVSEFVEKIRPELKILDNDQIADYVSNPRQGVTAASKGHEVIINNVNYRQLRSGVVDADTATALLGEKTNDLWYPEELASAIEDYMVRITDDTTLRGVAKVFDWMQSIWKGSVLLNPAWTTVNVLGGIIHSIAAGGLTPADFMKHWQTSRRLSTAFHFGGRKGGVVPWGKGINFDPNKTTVLGGREIGDVELARELVGINAIDGSQVAREVMTVHRTAFANADPRGKKGAAEWVRYLATLGPLGSWWFKYNASLDDTFRTLVYLARRDKGDTADTAILAMKRAHFDYGDFTRYEDKIGRRVIPFYAWMRNNIGLQFSLLLEKPAYAASYPKIKHAIEEALGQEEKVPEFMLPRYLRNSLVAQIAGNDGENKSLNIGSLTPIQDLMEIGQGLYGAEGFEEMAHYFLNSASPVLKIPMELALGKTSFTGESIGDPDLGEKSIREYMLEQIGYTASIKGYAKAAQEGGLLDALMRLAVRGRWRGLDVSKLQVGISIDENETIKKLRRALNKRHAEGDTESTERIAMRIVERYRIMYLSGLKHQVPKELHPVFNRERGMRRRNEIPEPGGWIPTQRRMR